MKTKLVSLFLFALTFITLADRAAVQAAPPPANPTGVWSGKFSDGSGSFSLVVQRDGSGGFAVYDAQGRYLRGASGRWSFLENSTGGVLTLTYFLGGEAHVHFGITWINERSVLLSDYLTPTGVPVRVVLYHL